MYDVDIYPRPDSWNEMAEGLDRKSANPYGT